MGQQLSAAVISSPNIENRQQQLQQPLGSLVKTSFEGRRHCWICSDVWMDILPFFDHAQLGLKLALISPRFDALVDAHFVGKSELTIWRPVIIQNMGTKTKLEVLRHFTKFVPFSIPQRPLPNKIRFEFLLIECIDQKVVEFLRSNQQIFDAKGTILSLNIFSSYRGVSATPIWNVFARQILPIFATSIRHLTFPNSDHLHKLLFVSPTLLTDLNQLNSMHIRFGGDGLLPDLIGDDFDGPKNAAVTSAADRQPPLSKWLHTPSTDGRPKRLWSGVYYSDNISRIKKWINNFKEAFLCANTAVSYQIYLQMHASTQIVPFELVNEGTQEKLILKKIKSKNHLWLLLNRCPISQMDQRKYNNSATDNLNNVILFLGADINCLGTGVPKSLVTVVNGWFNLIRAQMLPK